MENGHRLITENLLMTTGCENDFCLVKKVEHWGKEVHMQEIFTDVHGSMGLFP